MQTLQLAQAQMYLRTQRTNVVAVSHRQLSKSRDKGGVEAARLKRPEGFIRAVSCCSSRFQSDLKYELRFSNECNVAEGVPTSRGPRLF